jgi:hypothetical protein
MQIQATFPPVPASAGEARQLAGQALEQWGLAAAEETALLLLTELISNGVRHANTMLSLLVTYDGLRLHVGVRDHDTHPPSMAPASSETHHGWGLRLVNLLSSDWGTVFEPDGKTVWFDLDIAELSQGDVSGEPA